VNSSTLTIECPQFEFQNIFFVNDDTLSISTVSIVKSVGIFKDCAFADSDQFCCHLHFSSAFFSGCSFTNGKKSGLFLCEKSQASLNDCNISLNMIGIKCSQDSLLSIFASSFSKNFGGAISSESSYLSVSNCNFQNNGEICFDIHFGQLFIEESTISGHTASLSLKQISSVTLVKNNFLSQKSSAVEVNFSKVLSYFNMFDESQDTFISVVQSGSFYSFKDHFKICKTAISLADNSLSHFRESAFMGCDSGLIAQGGSLTLRLCSFSQIETHSIRANMHSVVDIRSTLFQHNSSSPILFDGVEGLVRDCIFSENNESHLSMKNVDEKLRFEKCIFEKSKTHGVFIIGSVSSVFNECTFSENNGNGIAISGSRSMPSFFFCASKNNSNSGVHIENNASPVFEGCEFSQNAMHGIVALSSNFVVKKCLFDSHIRGAGLTVNDKAVAQIEGSTFTGNEMNIQFTNPETKGSIKFCEIRDSHGGSGLVVFDNSIVYVSDTTFSQNKSSHIEAKSHANVQIHDSDFSDSVDGIAIFASENVHLQIVKSKISNETRCALYCDESSEIDISDCSITDCQNGISALNDSKIHVINSEILRMKINGIEIQGGGGTIENTTIGNCRSVGIQEVGSILLNLINIKFIDNQEKDHEKK
jgi:hypothetical protein